MIEALSALGVLRGLGFGQQALELAGNRGCKGRGQAPLRKYKLKMS